jgi:hypothetical protein
MFAFTVLTLCAVIGCTSAPAQKDRPVATAMPAAPSAAVPSAAVPSTAYVTGSHLPVPVDSRTGLPAPDPSLQVVTQQQLELTGYANLGAALRELVSAIR